MGYVFWQQIFVSPDAQTCIRVYANPHIAHVRAEIIKLLCGAPPDRNARYRICDDI